VIHHGDADRPHIPLEPYPVTLLTDPDAVLMHAVGSENEGHWAGPITAPVTNVVHRRAIVKWAYTSAPASDRPSPVALAKAAVAIASGNEPSALHPMRIMFDLLGSYLIAVGIIEVCLPVQAVHAVKVG
jgi:hypothetical protein